MTRHLDEKRLTGSNPSHWSETESTGRPSVRDVDNNQVTDRTYPMPAQLQLQNSNHGDGKYPKVK